MSVEQLVEEIKSHRCYSHPIFENWVRNEPEPEVIGALFHQIQSFCASTRPGGRMPEALKDMGFDEGSHLVQEIIESEDGHGPELATMAAYVINNAAGRTVFPDIHDQERVEDKLRELSDDILRTLPGWDPATGLLTQTQAAKDVFARRNLVDSASTHRNIGTALALEIISNRHLIPGEKRCLIDSDLYEASMEDPEMHYLLEHWGECGAESQHEQHATDLVGKVIGDGSQAAIREGAIEFLNALVAMWDVLDTALLQSGRKVKVAA